VAKEERPTIIKNNMNIGATEFCFALKKEKSIFKNKNKVLFKQEKLTSIKKCINK